jgi:hypothetical protein
VAEFFGKVVNLAFFTNATGMAREKRPFEMEGAREGVENEKRPRSGLARVIVEAVKIDSFQKVCSSLEPLLRKVVSICSIILWNSFSI